MYRQSRGFGDVFSPGGLVCAANEQISPIKAWVNSPNDPEYLAASNWRCVKNSVMAEQAGFTFAAGLKTWANPAYAALAVVSSFPQWTSAPSFAAGLLLPVAVVGLLLWPSGRSKR